MNSNPVSSHQGPPPQVVPTMRVKVIENGEDAVINKADFDPELHESQEPQRKRPQLRIDPLVGPEGGFHDQNDVKEPGPVKSKADKDELEARARQNIAQGKDGAKNLTSDPRVDVRPDAKR